MNRAYKTIWNAQTGAYVAVAETVKGRGKRSGSIKNVALVGVLIAVGGFPTMASADFINDSSTSQLGATGITCARPGDSGPWTCQIPTVDHGFATVSGIVGSDPVTAAVAWRDSNLGTGSIALGNASTSAGTQNSVAIGPNAKVILENSAVGGIAIGQNATVMHGTVTLPDGSVVVPSRGGYHGIAIGDNAQAHYSGEVVIGGYAGHNAKRFVPGSETEEKLKIYGSDSLLVGGNAGRDSEYLYATFIGDEAGRGSIGQHNSYVGQNAGRWRHGSQNTALGSNALVGTDNNSPRVGSNNTAIGSSAGSNLEGSSNVVIGQLSGFELKGIGNTDVGNTAGQETIGNFNTAIGINAGVRVIGSFNTASGINAGISVTGNNNIALGNSSGRNITANDTIAIGRETDSSDDKAIAIGAKARSAYAGSVALGADAETAEVVETRYVQINGQKYDFAGSSPESTVSVGSVGRERTITNVAAGRISETSTDAINGSQLHATNQALEKAAMHYYSVDNSLGELPNYHNDGATGQNAIAAGARAAASGLRGLAAGYGANAGGVDSTAIGARTVAAGDASTAVGGGANTKGYGAVSMGWYASSDGEAATALGAHANAVGRGASALGMSAQANGEGATALGNGAGAVGYRALAAGMGAKATARSAMAVGHGAQATADDSAALGTGAHATGIGSTAVGSRGAEARGVDATALGAMAHAMQDRAIAIGSDSEARARESVALGNMAKAVEYRAIAIGNYSDASAQNTVAIGAGAKALHDGSVALGGDSVTAAAIATSSITLNDTTYNFAGINPSSTVSVGSRGKERTITNVAAGRISATSTDAINGSQLHATNLALGKVGSDVINNNPLTFTGTTGSTERKLGETLAVVGSNGNITTEAKDGKLTIALNDDLNVTSVTTGNTVMNDGGITIAGGANGPIVLNNMGLTAGSVVISAVTGINAGGFKITNVVAGVADTDAVNVSQLKGVKNDIEDLSDRSVKYDGNTGDPKNQITLEGDVSTDGGKTGGTTITNLAQGEISSTSTDAVNGSQIHTMGESIANGMGGNSTFVDGKLVTELSVGGNTYTNVNDALNGLNTDIENVVDIAGAGWNVQTNGSAASNVAPKSTVNFQNGQNIKISNDGLNITIATADDLNVNSITAVTVNADTVNTKVLAIENGPVIDANGIDMSGKKITNLAEGTAATDAVNVSQLNKATGDINNNINRLENKVDRNDSRASAGVAAAMAVAGLPQAYLPGKSMVSMAGGTWRGESGYAMGLSTVTDNGKWIVKGAVTGSSRGDYGGTVGVGYQW